MSKKTHALLFYVPRMYTREEVRLLLSKVPDDYEEKEEEFWNYVDEKLSCYQGRIKRIYRDMITKSGDEGLKYLSTIDEQNYKVVKKLVDTGASLMATEDPMLVAEAESWVALMGYRSNLAIHELFRENLLERNRFISNTILETIGDNEEGVLFIEPSREIPIQEDFKVIKIKPFQPSDYINSWIAKLKVMKSKSMKREENEITNGGKI